MLVLLSPAKTLNEKCGLPPIAPTMPRLLPQSQALIETLRKLSVADIQALMGVSEKIAQVNFTRYANFGKDNGKAALLLFKGDVYTAMQAEKYNAKEWEFAQANLRMLSGLYGVLRPADLMQAYRLEMGTKLANSGGKNLYDFWRGKICPLLNQDIENAGAKQVINLASQEYASAVDFKQLCVPTINVQFKEQRGNKLQIIGIMAKRARGLMADYIVSGAVTSPEKLFAFNVGGYEFREDLSAERDYVFVR